MGLCGSTQTETEVVVLSGDRPGPENVREEPSAKTQRNNDATTAASASSEAFVEPIPRKQEQQVQLIASKSSRLLSPPDTSAHPSGEDLCVKVLLDNSFVTVQLHNCSCSSDTLGDVCSAVSQSLSSSSSSNAVGRRTFDSNSPFWVVDEFGTSLTPASLNHRRAMQSTLASLSVRPGGGGLMLVPRTLPPSQSSSWS